MKANHNAENVLGTIGTILWSGQILPQIWKSWREKSTYGLSGQLMFIWATSAVFLGVYNIVQDINIPLIIQPLFGALAALSWVQCLYYGSHKPRIFCIVIYLLYLAVFAGFEAGVSYGTREYREDNPSGGDKAIRFFGVFSAVLVSVGLIPQYIEIYKLKEVLGISMVFLSIDMAGGVFSLLSLVFRDTFDVTASITYICVVVLDGVVVVCAIILNPRARRRREREAQLAAATATAAADGQSSIPPSSTNATLDSSPSDLEKGVHIPGEKSTQPVQPSSELPRSVSPNPTQSLAPSTNETSSSRSPDVAPSLTTQTDHPKSNLSPQAP